MGQKFYQKRFQAKKKNLSNEINQFHRFFFTFLFSIFMFMYVFVKYKYLISRVFSKEMIVVLSKTTSYIIASLEIETRKIL